MAAGESGRIGPSIDIERARTRIDEEPEDKVVRRLMERFQATISEPAMLGKGRVRIRIDKKDLFDACRYLKDSLGFEHISMISAVEYDARFDIVYHITSYQSKLLLELITTTTKDDPSVDSVSSVWGGANWQERESYDLMGIVFKNHPKLERILLPKDTLYHPLRKDFR
jgi:NADH-quinone oxidoreductase subunit C